MVSLAAYFDESGIHDGSPVVAVAGLIASTKQWKEFDNEWRGLLKKDGISVFHMTDFENNRGEFNDWTRERKIAFLKDLIEAVQSKTRLYLAHAVRTKEFEEIKADYGNINISAYQLCCEQCMTGLSTWAMKSPQRKEVAAYFEQGNKIMSETMKLFNEVPDSEWLRNKYRISKVVYARKENDNPLQAADLLAYETYKYHRNLIDDPMRPLRKSFEALLRGKKYVGHMNNNQTIRNWFDLILKNRALA